MKMKSIVAVAAGIVTGLIFLTAVFSATFFLTALVYRNTARSPSPLAAQLINSLLGLFFVFLILSGLGFFFGSRKVSKRRGMFSPIIEALEKIAKGDFSVRLDNYLRAGDPVGALARSVNEMAAELNQMEAMRQEFVANVSHEIQSPLTSIRGFARALQDEDLSPEERFHYLDIIETESMRLSRLSDNLLELASLESENVRFEPKPYRLDQQIRNLILACEPQWADKGIDMDISVEEVSLTADEDLLSHVWGNLIYNSIKFTPAGGRVFVDLHRQDGHVQFRIADTGPGISEADQARIFERFFKADKSRNRSRGGSGLGLAIAKKIVELHQGAISVQSELGAGATFTVLLPGK